MLRCRRHQVRHQAEGRRLEDHEELAHLPDDLEVAMAISRTYGWRTESEVFRLEQRHLDLKAGTPRLDPGRTKNSEGRVVYLRSELARLLGAQVDRVERLSKTLGRIVPWLFPHFTGRRAGTRRKVMRKRWQTATRRVGVPGRILHDFRRTVVRDLERQGVVRSVAMKITGHTDLREATAKLERGGHNSGHSGQGVVDSASVSHRNS